MMVLMGMVGGLEVDKEAELMSEYNVMFAQHYQRPGDKERW